MSGHYFKKLSGLGLALGLALGATAANATTWTVQSASASSSGGEVGSWSVRNTAGSTVKSGDSYIGQIALTVNDPSGGTFVVNSFCVDVYDALTTPATFTTDTLASLGLSQAKNYQLSNLLLNIDAYISTGSLGSNTSASAGTAADRSAAAQLAIWEIVNETSDSVYNVDANNGGFGLFAASDSTHRDTLTATALSDANGLLNAVKSATSYAAISVSVVRSAGNQTQIVYGTGATRIGDAVPEPATWGMMVLGFGVLGAALRRSKVKTGAFA